MKRKLRIKTRILTVITLLLLGVSLFPFYYMVVQSFTQWDMVDKVLIPQGFTLRSYEYLISKGGASNSMMWVRALVNSFIVSLPTALISVAVGLGIGYSVTKLRFGGKKFIMNTLLFQMFFPAIILLVPRYMIAKPMANKYVGMIIPLSISVWAIFMYINYFRTLPDAVFEAARIDGATRGQYFWKIALPLLIPSIKSAAILSMVGSLKYFDLIYVMTGGGPGTATELMATYMYKESFKNFNMGYGSAIAGGMFILITMVSMITMKLINGKQED